ncbi:hypothetical protein C809_02192 [Lachnospiraceae bacterium MD335]|nr:hypothetical protein C809_02192 [Lachnospiraceae bacterium MD335]
MKIIRISTDLELTVHEFPIGTHARQNQFLRELIGNYCSIYEHVMPRRLYTELHMKDEPTEVPGQCVSMLVDEEGRLKENDLNLIGSYLYETDRHKNYIMGNVLFVGEELTDNGIDFCGIEESTFKVLEQQLNKMILEGKAAKEAVKK